MGQVEPTISPRITVTAQPSEEREARNTPAPAPVLKTEVQYNVYNVPVISVVGCHQERCDVSLQSFIPYMIFLRTNSS